MARARGLWTAVRKRPFKATLLVMVVAAILLTRSAILSPSSSPMPSFQFLAGRSPAFMVDDSDRSSRGWSRDFYSFVCDFNSVCEAADTELAASGFTVPTPPAGSFFATRDYLLRLSSPSRMVSVRIMDGAKLMVYSTPENSQYVTPDRYSYKAAPGWVSVEICQRRCTLWQDLKWKVDYVFWKMGF